MPLGILGVSIAEPPPAFRAMHRRLASTPLTITGHTYALQVRGLRLFFFDGRHGRLAALHDGCVGLEVFARRISAALIRQNLCGIAGGNLWDGSARGLCIFLA